MTPNPQDESQLLQEFQQELNQYQPGQPPPLPQQQQSQAPPTSPNEDIATLRNEIARLQGLVEASQYPRREAPQEPQAPVAPPPQPQDRWAKPSVEQWVERMKIDPVTAINESIAAAWGLPEGVLPQQVLTGLAQELQTTRTALQNAYQTANTAQQQAMAATLALEAQNFRDSHEDYDPKDWQHIEANLKSHNLPPNRQGLEAAWALAKTSGAIKTPTPPQQQAYAPPQPQGAPYMPSLRPNQAQSTLEPTTEALIAQLDTMPDDVAERYLANFKRRLG